jgi:hypothetical protein
MVRYKALLEKDMPMMPKLDEIHLAALRELQVGLSTSTVRWVLTGSAGFALQGVPVVVQDLDVQTDAAGAYEIARRFARAVIEPVYFWDSGSMRSHFGALELSGVRVEVMGDISKRNPDGSWDCPPNLAALTCWVDVADLRVPVLALEYECEAYRKMGRLDKADLLQRWLAMQEGE